MTWTDTIRTITPKLEMQWDGVNWSDETQYMLDCSGRVSATPLWKLLGKTAATQPSDTLSLSMSNADRYSPFNASSSIYSYISSNRGYGIPVRFFLSYDGINFERVFTGRIDNLSITSTQNNRAKISCISEAQSVVRNKISTSMNINQTQSYFISYLASLAGVSSTSLSSSFNVVPYAWLSDESVMSEMVKVAQSDGGRVYFNSDGTLVYKNMEDWITDATANTVQHAFTVSRAKDFSVSFDRSNVYDKVIVVYSPRVMVEGTVLWSLPNAITIAPGESKVIECKYNRPAINISLADQRAISYSGDDVTASVTFATSNVYAQRATITITNGTTKYVVVTGVSLSGNPIIGRKAGQVEMDVTSPSVTDKTLYISGNEFIQNEAQASLVCEFVRDTVSVVRNVYRFEAPYIPTLAPFHMVSVTETDSGISSNGYISSISWKYNKNGARANYEVIDADNWIPDSANYFRIGTDTLNGGRVAFY